MDPWPTHSRPSSPSPPRRRRPVGRRILDALHDYQMRRVERALRFHGHVLETRLVQGELRRIGLSQADGLPFNR